MRSAKLIQSLLLLTVTLTACDGRSEDIPGEDRIAVSWGGEPVYLPYNVIDGWVVIGGDMVLGRADILLRDDSDALIAGRREALGSQTFENFDGSIVHVGRWPGAVVPYEITTETYPSGTASFTEVEVAQIEAAIAEWNAAGGSSFSFRPATASDAIALRILPDDPEALGSCRAVVGYHPSAAMWLGSGSYCFSQSGTLVHELGHVLGAGHEHQRFDRDAHVSLHRECYAGSDLGWEQSFSGLHVQGCGAYDEASVMHYASTSGSKTWECMTLTTSGGARLARDGSISALDADGMQRIYAGVDSCNGQDDDCDGAIDEDGGSGSCSVGIGQCRRTGSASCSASGHPVCNVDEGSPSAETCDGLDNDCDGDVDEALGGDSCSAGVGTCVRSGVRRCDESTQTMVCDAPPAVPVDELCDGVDNDCDGEIDEDFPTLGERCSTGDGVCRASGIAVCSADRTRVVCDAEPAVTAVELCNGQDDDCDGLVDETFASLGASCAVGVGQCERTGAVQCGQDAASVICSAVAGSPSRELCDGYDNDCDGVADNLTGQAFECSVGVGVCRRDGLMQCDGTCGAVAGEAGEEICDEQDNDCDGEVDEDVCEQDGAPPDEKLDCSATAGTGSGPVAPALWLVVALAVLGVRRRRRQ